MSKKSVFTFLNNYKLVLLIGLIVILSGCSSASGQPIDPEEAGFFDRYFVYTFYVLIKGIATYFDGNYGLAIVLMTLIVRLLLMPLMLKQTKSSYQMRERMKVMKPELDEIHTKYKDKKGDKNAQKDMQQELMQLYTKHNFNPMTSMGCLPMIIQFPILIGFYYAIRTTPQMAEHTFLWFNLGQTDLIMPFIAAAIYFVQFKVSQIGMDEKQRKQMAMIGLLSPIMIGVVSFTTPAALPLYWAVGGIFLIFQQLLSKKLYQSKFNLTTTEHN